MRILIVLGQNKDSVHALNQVAKLAANTWANITLLGVLPKKTGLAISSDFIDTINKYQKTVLDHFDSAACPYSKSIDNYELAEIKPGVFEKIYASDSRLKDLKVKIRIENPVKSILEEAHENDSDLIVLPCDMEGYYKVAISAECSVLAVKKEINKKRVLCCLDHDLVSQKSLEMISQMATLFNADLAIAGLTKKYELKKNVQEKLDWLLKYYISKNIQPWIELVEISCLEKFISQENQWSLVTMWMGEKSIFEKIFHSSKVKTLLKNSRSSVLMLR
ncbi:MAG: universal stress protein [Deltaproteobacteria bacterium]|nr:universal stress protein [Deltaproteobacteria bacterium]